MFLKTLSITQFKNCLGGYFQFSQHVNFLTGDNGSGKTNVLDAIHYLCLGKSYFHGNDQQAVQHDTSFFRLEGNFLNAADAHQIVCAYPSTGKKEVSRNGITYQRLIDHIGLIPVVMIAPDDHSIIDGGSEERRRLIDNTLSQIDHAYLEELVSYNKVLMQRNAILKQFAIRKTFDISLIESLDEQLASYGKNIFIRRLKYLDKLIPLIEMFYEIICENKESANTRYNSICHHTELLKALQLSLEKDRVAERTTEGIHRDELEWQLNGMPVKKYGSQGQKKSFLIAVKLAQYKLIQTEKNCAPILMLDDLFDRLDEHRSQKILRLIADDGFGQVFITDTNAARIRRNTEHFQKEYKEFEIKQERSILQAAN